MKRTDLIGKQFISTVEGSPTEVVYTISSTTDLTLYLTWDTPHAGRVASGDFSYKKIMNNFRTEVWKFVINETQFEWIKYVIQAKNYNISQEEYRLLLSIMLRPIPYYTYGERKQLNKILKKRKK